MTGVAAEPSDEQERRDDEERRDEQARRDFFEKALGDAGRWAQFADPKALAALAILGLALANLLSIARPLVDAHHVDVAWGTVATGAFWLAVACAAVTVACVAVSLFPRVRPDGPALAPLYFFGHIAAFKAPSDFEGEVRRRSARELESAIAAQAWEVARVAGAKHRWARRALQAVLVFLVCWATARLALALSR